MSTKMRPVFGGSTSDLDPAPDPYLGCIFLTLIEDPLYLWLQSHLCLTLDHVEGQCKILIQFWIYICVVPFEGPPHLWLLYHLCLTLDHVEGQCKIWIQFWIYICVVPFEGPPHLWLLYHLCLTLDHVGGSTPDLDPDPSVGCEFRAHSSSGTIYVSS